MRFLGALWIVLWASLVQAQPAPNSTPFSAIIATTNTAISIAVGAHNITGLQFASIASANTYVKFYDTAVVPVCGVGTPVKRLQIGAGNAILNPLIVPIPVPIKFINGIGLCVTAGIADTDTTAPTANQTIVNVDWQ